jgi:murein DD-endopeptidase MepM/ murein hydrolase activator NlpD
MSKVAMIALAAAALGGCSSDTGRFGGEPVYTGSTPNQREILSSNGQRADYRARPWTNVDTTGSIAPSSDVVGRRDLEPMPPVTQSYAPAPVVQPTYVAPAPQTYAAPPPQTYAAPAAPVVAAPAQPYEPAPQRVAAANGWTATGGTWVTLQPGETVDTLARRYGVPSSAIVQTNNFSAANRPVPGGRVLIPVYSAGSVAAAPAPAPVVQPAPAVRQIPIARPAGVGTQPTSLQAQAQAQRAPMAPQPIARAPQPGQPAPLPVAAPRAPAPAPLTQAKAPDHGGVRLVGDYTVRPGDTLGSIARTYGVSEQALRERNGLRTTMLQPGQHLILPAGTKLMLKTSEATPKPLAGEVPKAVAQAPVAAPTAKPPVAPVQTATVVAAKPGQPAQPPLSDKEKAKIDQKAAETIAVAKETASAEESTASAAAGSFRWPVRGRVISEFGSKPNGERNEGINLAVPEGTSIKAADDGEVIYSGNELKGYGNLVLVRHSNGFVTAYAHASQLLVNRGDKISRGQIIARAGATGSVTQPQLHFELRKGQKAIDPKPYLASN